MRKILGSCALAWAVKEVPDSEDGPPDAELPRQTDIDPFAQGEARKVRAGSLSPQCHFGGVRIHFSPVRRRVGSIVDRPNTAIREEAPTVGAIVCVGHTILFPIFVYCQLVEM